MGIWELTGDQAALLAAAGAVGVDSEGFGPHTFRRANGVYFRAHPPEAGERLC